MIKGDFITLAMAVAGLFVLAIHADISMPIALAILIFWGWIDSVRGR